MITVDGKSFPHVSFKPGYDLARSPILVTYYEDGELSFLYCESPLSDRIRDAVSAVVSELTDGRGESIRFWSHMPQTR